jgi:hypothetical protein
MPLTTCKKCAKICSSSDATCPYCGAALSQHSLVVSDDEKQGNFRIAVFGFFIGFFLLFALVFMLLQNNLKRNSVDAGSTQSCQSVVCPAGTKAVTDTALQKPYYTCKSQEFSDYANYVLNVMLAQTQFAGVTPEISGKTGEPVVQGKEKSILDTYRANAGVSTFEEAIAKCYKGIGRQTVIVLYNPAQGDSLYVAAEENQADKFWLPKARLHIP